MAKNEKETKNAGTKSKQADVNTKGDAELTEEEKTALEVQQASASGKETKKKVKLANPDTQYAESDFTLQGDQEKELPDNPSPELIQRIRAGFIKEV